MKNKFLLKINYEFRHNVKYISSFDLIIDNRVRKRIMDEKLINYLENMIRLENPTKKIIENEVYISDEEFIKNHVNIPSKKINTKNNYGKKVAIVTTLGLSFIATSILDHKINPDLYHTKDNDLTTEDDFEKVINNNDIDENIAKLDNIDTPMVFESENNGNIKIKYFSDNEDIYENESNKNELLSSDISSFYDNVFTYNVECEDLSDDELLNFIKETYKVPIYLASRKFGKDPNLIAAKIRRENPRLEVRDPSESYGYGTLQIERNIWEDKDNNIDFDKVNNIPEDHVNMDKVSNYINSLSQINSFDELYNLTLSLDDMNKYNITEDDLEKYKNVAYGLEKGCEIWEQYDNEIINKNKNNEYNYVISNEECIILGNWAYNMGIDTVNTCINNSSSFEETINQIRNVVEWGDNNYDKNTFCYIKNGSIIENRLRDGSNIYIMVNHLELDNKITM